MLTATQEPQATPKTALALGFATPEGPITGPTPVLSDEVAEQGLQESIRQKALVHVDLLSEILAKRALDPTATVKTVVDALDANYKLSGLAAKNLPKDGGASGVTITINIPTLDPASPGKNLVIEGTATEVPADADEPIFELDLDGDPEA